MDDWWCGGEYGRGTSQLILMMKVRFSFLKKHNRQNTEKKKHNTLEFKYKKTSRKKK